MPTTVEFIQPVFPEGSLLIAASGEGFIWLDSGAAKRGRNGCELCLVVHEASSNFTRLTMFFDGATAAKICRLIAERL
jgi:hypothetical protein